MGGWGGEFAPSEVLSSLTKSIGAFPLSNDGLTDGGEEKAGKGKEEEERQPGGGRFEGKTISPFFR